jgi:hypothetical protein
MLNKKTYLNALKDADEQAYSAVEAELLEMGEAAVPIFDHAIGYYVRRLEKHIKQGNFCCLSGFALIFALIGSSAFMSIDAFSTKIPLILFDYPQSVLVIAVFGYIALYIIGSKIGSHWQSSLHADSPTVALPRLIQTANKVPYDTKVQWLLRLKRSVGSEFPELLGSVMEPLLSLLEDLDRKRYFALPQSARQQMLTLFKTHSAFLLQPAGEEMPNGVPRSDYDVSVCLAMLRLAERVGDTAYKDLVYNIQYTFHGSRAEEANRVKAEAQRTYSKLKSAPKPPEPSLLLRPSSKPTTNEEDLLLPVEGVVVEEDDLLKPAQSPEQEAVEQQNLKQEG